MTNETHNGWTNYATWRVNLEMIDGMSAAELGCDNVRDLSEELRHYCRAVVEAQGEGLALDYALAFLGEVNWHEIASHMLESV